MNLKHVKNFEDLKLAKNEFYGPKGAMKKLQIEIKNANPGQRGKIGKKISELKNSAETAFDIKLKELENEIINQKLDNEWIDVSINKSEIGSLHPLQLITNKITR
jgi:phenylalanyl-tRNA synthetase alpha chain